MDKQAVIDRLQKATQEAGSQVAFARQHQLTAPYVNDVLHGKRNPGPAILKALGLEKTVSYQEEPDDRTD